MRARGRLLAGTSGWMYRHWADFYRGIPPRRQLEYISRRFPTVEINASFYMLPRAESFANWAAQTPDGFVFAVKASRFMTHMKRLLDPAPAAEKLLLAARHLGDKLGPILLQLPPMFHARPDRLDGALAAFREVGAGLGLTPALAVEFRHASWFTPETRAVMKRHRASLVIAHSMRWPIAPKTPLTAPWIYLRFHGAGASGAYGVTRLRPWAADIRRWLAAGHDVFAYFNNDWDGHALRDARTLMRLAGGELPHEDPQALFPRERTRAPRTTPAARRRAG